MADIKQITVTGNITATSNKQLKNSTGESRKTIYFTTDEKRKLEDFGLIEYTPQDGVGFFVAKASEKIKLYTPGVKESIGELLATVDQPNFSTKVPVTIALLQGKSEQYNTAYTRVFAIRVNNPDDIEFIEAQNPFED